MAPPQWAYQVENFVNKPDDELICSVCHSIFCDPIICPCDHVFCRACITKWLQNNRNCPICRKRVPRYSFKQMVPIIKNLIMKLTLYCRNKEHGCEAQFTLEGCEAHMKECNYELVQCKNKPCREKLFRKDIQDHETNGCPHRYIKCKTCGSKMSSSSSHENHNCIRALQTRLRKKNTIIRRKNERIKELQDEIKTLKERPRDSAESLSSPSTVSSLSQEEIMIDLAELDSLPTESSESEVSNGSILAIFSNNQSQYSNGNRRSNPFQLYMENHNRREDPRSESPLDLSEYRNAESQTIDDLSSGENQSESYNMNESLFENDSIAVEVPDSADEREERSRRRPAKRRLPLPVLSTSDEDNNEAARVRSLPSLKRCWRRAAGDTSGGQSENNPGDSSNSYMEAGPSSKAAVTDSNTSTHDATSSNTKWRFASKGLNQKHAKDKAKKSSYGSKSALSGNAVFERTLALLEQYNLESDPEWLPEYASHRGDTTSESNSSLSDSSYEVEVIGDSDASLSDSDSVNGGRSSITAELIHGLYRSSSEDDDPDWRPIHQ